jgi:hypothetical protein
MTIVAALWNCSSPKKNMLGLLMDLKAKFKFGPQKNSCITCSCTRNDTSCSGYISPSFLHNLDLSVMRDMATLGHKDKICNPESILLLYRTKCLTF